MDTKSKRFDKLSIIKFICIVLSLVFTFAGTLKLIDFSSFIIENELYDEFFDTIENEIFDTYHRGDSRLESEYRSFTQSALLKGLLYTSADNKGYKLYTDKVRKAYRESIIDIIMDSECENSEYLIFYALDKGYISLELIEPLKKAETGIFCYEAGKGYRIWADKDAFDKDEGSFEKIHTLQEYDEDYDNYDEDCDYYEYDSYFEDMWDRNDEDYTVPVTTSPASETEGQNGGRTYISEKNGLDDYFVYISGEDRTYDIKENKHGTKYCDGLALSSEKLNKISADAIVDITNSKYNGEYYNGYYSVKINENNIDISNPDMICTALYGTYSVDEKEYTQWCEELSETGNSYQNAFYAVLDEETGNFTTNYHLSDNVSPETVAELFGKYTESYMVLSSDDVNANWQNDFQRSVKDEFISFSKSNAGAASGKFTLWVAYDSDLKQTDIFSGINNANQNILSELKNTAIPFAVCALGYLICLIALIFLSGRKSYDDELHMGRFDGIFTDLRTVLDLGLIACGIYALIMLFVEYNYSSPLTRIPMLLKAAVGAAGIILPLIFTDWILYLSRHIKNSSLLKNISFVRLIRLIIKRVKVRKEKRRLSSAEYKDFKKRVLPIFIPVFAVLNIVAFVTILVASDYVSAFAVLLPVLIAFDVFCIWLIFRFVLGLKMIFSAIHKMRSGEQNVSVDLRGMPSSLRAYAEDVNSVSEGFSIAVENATKEQRTRTELITNVSHDLKTPLTSIISYVDLLSKRPINDEEALRYIDVLGEKSEKLKRLIEDLVEASKASAGNIAVNMVKVSVHELISQIVGEYEDDLAKRGLGIFTEERSGDLTVDADSKLACRVFDNLMINVKKYAMPGTRVYIRIFPDDDCGCIAISNISEQQLNIPASQLKERFVRGDESRHSDGNGLGLAIAEDFMSLQNGSLDLFINGDMFTAVVKFKLSK